MQFIFFLIFIFAVLTCGTIKVGPFSLRVYMTVLMLAFLLLARRSSAVKPFKIRTDYIIIFLLCIVTLGISLFFNNGLETFGYFDLCLSHYLVCIVTYFSIDYCINNNKQIDSLVLLISFIILLDTIVTLLQYQNNPIGWGIAAIFSNIDDIEEFAFFLSDHESFAGVSKLPGIFGHPVNNGFFLAVSTPMLLTSIKKGSSWLKAFPFFFVILFAIVALFFLQQRAAFFLVLIVIAYEFFLSFVKHPRKILLPAIVIFLIILLFIPTDFEDKDSSRLSSFDNSSRRGLLSWAFTVIFDNPLFGNYVRYNQSADYSAHNVFVDSLIDSGIFGFIPLCYFYIKTVLDSLHIWLNNLSNYSRIFSYSVIICMGMGMFHNTSYLTGDAIIFLSLALMFKAQVLSNINN